MSGTYTVNGDKLTGLTVYSTLPIGTPMAWLSDNLPVGFLKFDGSEYNQSDYPQLWAIVQNIPEFQSETEGKFKIPNLSGRVLQGADNVLGALLEAGLPNIKGSFQSEYNGTGYYGIANKMSGAFNGNGFNYKSNPSHGSTFNLSEGVNFDASKSNPIYSDDCDTVQSPAFTVNWIIKAVDYVSLPQNAIDDEHTTTGNALSAAEIQRRIDEKNIYNFDAEVVVGYAIKNGVKKPIYRKTIYKNSNITTTTPLITNADDFILATGWVLQSQTNTITMLPWFYNSQIATVEFDNNTINFKSNNVAVSEICITVEYTKTIN